MKYIGYIRVPKTGSRCIADYLLENQNSYMICGNHHLPYTILNNHDHSHTYISIVRDPLQLYCSFYFFMKKRSVDLKMFNNPLDYTQTNEKNMELLLSNVCLEEFLLECPPNQMLSYFIDPLPINDIDFIGTLEQLDKSIYCLNSIYNFNIKNYKENYNIDKIEDSYSVSDDIRKKFISRNVREYEIYNMAMESLEKTYRRLSINNV